jgi:hypothetical protein
MKYDVQMASGGMIYISSLTKIGSGVHTLLGGDTQQSYFMTPILFYFIFQNEDTRLKTVRM